MIFLRNLINNCILYYSLYYVFNLTLRSLRPIDISSKSNLESLYKTNIANILIRFALSFKKV